MRVDRFKPQLAHCVAVLGVLAGVSLASPGSAATREQAQAQFKENSELCKAVQHPQDRASCFAWAARVFKEAMRGL